MTVDEMVQEMVDEVRAELTEVAVVLKGKPQEIKETDEEIIMTALGVYREYLKGGLMGLDVVRTGILSNRKDVQELCLTILDDAINAVSRDRPIGAVVALGPPITVQLVDLATGTVFYEKVYDQEGATEGERGPGGIQA